MLEVVTFAFIPVCFAALSIWNAVGASFNKSKHARTERGFNQAGIFNYTVFDCIMSNAAMA